MLPKLYTYLAIFSQLFLVYGTIHKNLKYFQIITPADLTHKIVKRGLQESNHPYNKIKEVHLNTHGQNFRLILSPKRGILHSKFKAYSVNADGEETHVPIDHDSFFEGRVFGETDSHVNMHIDEEGVLTGNIHMPDDIYHIEPSWRHIPEHDNKTMITYKQSDIKFSWDPDNLPSDFPTPRTCAYVKEGAELEENETSTHNIRKRQLLDPYDMYKFTKTRCPLLLVADYRFFQEMGGSNTKTTINYLISLIDRVHKIYNDTNWQERQEIDGFKGMGFVIKKIVVHNEPTRPKTEAHYNMFRDKWDVRNLLEVFSREFTHKDFCLAHLFTDLKFEGGILGLAYVGSPRRNSVGGICTPEYFKNGYTLYLNSGLSSSRNHYGQRVITREADLVTAHEFGHNWGSEHDPDIPECSPSASQGGSYLMYTYSVSGYDVNNKRFSPCSLRSIRKVLQAKSDKCFSEPEESFCGNLRVEGDEECDAGLLGTEDNDPCCDKDCKLRIKAMCSDKNSPCCQNCQYMRNGLKCREAQYATCEEESKCTGHSSECPKSPPMADNTDCQERGKCRNGKCVPFCETQGMQSCMCDVIENACKRCCRSSINETCSPVDSADLLADGTPCIQGFCNNGLCEKTVQDVVERFWDIIEDININKVMLFLRDNIVGTVVLSTAVVWIPASCIIGFVDRRRRRRELKRKKFRQSGQLIDSSDKDRKKKVYKIRVQNARNNTEKTSEESSPSKHVSSPKDDSPAKQHETPSPRRNESPRRHECPAQHESPSKSSD
ncbi:ADAM 17-like protease isoform X2 [Anthonomus grandis grandis]|uniref:ADAM 17-like protease isoform X2 n=1 Tax=Anthonomus grandis grandis TaxID=2921223 RepID=UPI0021668D8D|nr:ADAM 17-like protease isoform X2 [Anthonomus grandis grandis]